MVSCISSGGRPETQIHLEPDDGEDVQNEAGSDSCTQTQTVVLPAADYHGQDVACVFQHPKFSHAERRVVTLPSFCEYRLPDLDPGEFAEENTDVHSFRLLQICPRSACGAQIRRRAPVFCTPSPWSCRKDGGVTSSSACRPLDACHDITFPAKGEDGREEFMGMHLSNFALIHTVQGCFILSIKCLLAPSP